MSESDLSPNDVVVMPIRFTDHLPRMREFLSLLGFAPRVSRRESWTTMAGAAGMVALHAADISGSGPGDTGLSFEMPDVDALAARFAAAGVTDVSAYDEAYGRVLSVGDHGGGGLTFDERPRDLYGYQLDQSPPEHGIVAMPLRFEPPTAPVGRLLSAAGFVRLEEGDDAWWRVWSGPGGGLVALHPPGDDAMSGSVRLGFRTRQPVLVQPVP